MKIRDLFCPHIGSTHTRFPQSVYRDLTAWIPSNSGYSTVLSTCQLGDPPQVNGSQSQ